MHLNRKKLSPTHCRHRGGPRPGRPTTGARMTPDRIPVSRGYDRQDIPEPFRFIDRLIALPEEAESISWSDLHSRAGSALLLRFRPALPRGRSKRTFESKPGGGHSGQWPGCIRNGGGSLSGAAVSVPSHAATGKRSGSASTCLVCFPEPAHIVAFRAGNLLQPLKSGAIQALRTGEYPEIFPFRVSNHCVPVVLIQGNDPIVSLERPLKLHLELRIAAAGNGVCFSDCNVFRSGRRSFPTAIPYLHPAAPQGVLRGGAEAVSLKPVRERSYLVPLSHVPLEIDRRNGVVGTLLLPMRCAAGKPEKRDQESYGCRSISHSHKDMLHE